MLPHLSEAARDLYDSFIDPDEPLYDVDGVRWLPVGAQASGAAHAPAFANEQQLRDIRQQCRALAVHNEFAINGHENRVSYIVGPGHNYRATVKKGLTAAPDLPLLAQAVLDEFLSVNQWTRRQAEIVRRRDRDGEVFLRFFVDAAGLTRVRFVEPDQVSTPSELYSNPAAAFGILTDRHDVEDVIAYFVDGQPVAAADIQHRKANVDGNVRRGLPLFYPVRKNLRRAEKLLRNMSSVAEIQSAIALIRRHASATRTAVQQFVGDQAAAAVTDPTTGKARTVQRYQPGTIIDAPAGIEYEFPAAALDATKFVAVLQAELRAIASRLVMPEFMLTSDASNGNYSSTLMAEGPALRMFARLQAEQIADDVQVLRRVLANAVATGRLPSEALTALEVQAAAPSLEVRDPLKEAQLYKIEHAAGILSPQTWSQRRGLDYEQEQANRREMMNAE